MASSEPNAILLAALSTVRDPH
ncbi:MAG: hypothetical protein RL522_14, partial [Pseudomonadota bacterium]